MEDNYGEPPVVEKKKRTKNAKRIKDIEKAILQQSLVIKEAKDFYRELVNEYNELTGGSST